MTRITSQLVADAAINIIPASQGWTLVHYIVGLMTVVSVKKAGCVCVRLCKQVDVWLLQHKQTAATLMQTTSWALCRPDASAGQSCEWTENVKAPCTMHSCTELR